MTSVVVEREIACESERASLWCAVADTERLNRAIGLGPIAAKPLSTESAARFTVATVSGGFALEYEERPFEFVENERFVVRRLVKKGMVRSIEHSFELTPRPGGGTMLRIRISVEAPGVLAPLVKIQVRRFVAKIEQELRSVDAEIVAGKGACFLDTRSAIDESALGRAKKALCDGVPEQRLPYAEKLVKFVRDGSDADVSRIRPFELAAELGVDEREMLATCLSAVGAGLVELRWDLICPSCRTANDRIVRLSELPTSGHCQLCDISYELEFDRAVEATFQPSSAIRTGLTGPFCIGGPMLTPHVVAQAILPPGGSVQLKAPPIAGRYRLFVRGGAAAGVEVGPSGATAARYVAGDTSLDGDRSSLAPEAEITISQTLDRERHVKLERLNWASRAATAHHVSTLPEFRRSFAAEVLKSGVSLRVARAALLFTDLTGSTALYERVGDAKAFHVVHDHFAILSRVVAEHRGSVVKTIGDAVMASFVEDGDAVRAAVAMHRAFPA
ncbi:MAG TPA: DUF5939 domain-containing protein, partial [Polyangiaceae bacterium]|nr:DUF5939 domain-containing protein [Polyangiaceae bacterium]